MINYSVGKSYNPISGSYSYRAYPQYTDLTVSYNSSFCPSGLDD